MTYSKHPERSRSFWEITELMSTPKLSNFSLIGSMEDISIVMEARVNSADVTFDHVKKWLALYFFADDIDLDELANEALVLYKACSELTLPCSEEIELIYENTLEESPLRENVLHTLVEESFDRGPKDFELFRDFIACNEEFAREFSKALKEHNGLATAKDCLFQSCKIHTKAKASRKPCGNRRRRR